MKTRRFFMAIAMLTWLGGALLARPRTLQKRDERGAGTEF